MANFPHFSAVFCSHKNPIFPQIFCKIWPDLVADLPLPGAPPPTLLLNIPPQFLNLSLKIYIHYADNTDIH